MRPVVPEPRKGFSTPIIAKAQPEYQPVPANMNHACTEFKIALSWRERFMLFFSGSLYMVLLGPPQPIRPFRLTVERDEEIPVL